MVKARRDGLKWPRGGGYGRVGAVTSDRRSEGSNSRDRKPSQGSRPPRDGRPSSRGGAGRDSSRDSSRDSRGSRPPSPRDRPPPPDEFADVDIYVLSREVRKDLEGLSEVNQERVAKLLAAARIAMDEDDDPERAFELTQRAAKSAGRVAVVREAAGIAAYQVGKYDIARKELQAARRIAGRNDLIPMLADCDRALNEPTRAIALADSPEGKSLRGADQAELILVVSGARRDLGQLGEATSILAAAAKQTPAAAAWASRVFYAYADALAEGGKIDEARDWFAQAAMVDADGELDSNDRIDELDTGA